ncbi:hypothetical protein [Ottowia sp.]|uniref:hypothetical protein n=1 Tax=Ottowia sp. TaxID=1898956 RepID=UPI002B8CEB65|nr:hypothetical protein [Ottowia sp.]HOB66264.1 hypothetical protein [Ottowia sp.]HPZ56838.1 hypothetical protein [Ottowia sp.]HQD49032.1 hypothetical protein [Ottowia sp.]
MFHWLDELVDTVIHLRDLRHCWRIYAGVALGFGLVLWLASSLPSDRLSVPLLVICLLVPGILGALWHKAAQRD